MNKDFNDNSYSGLKTIPLKKIGERINLRNNRSIKKWLNDHDISIIKHTKESCVYQVDFDFHNEKPFVLSLRRKYPQKWKEMYRAVCNDDAVYNLMMLHMEEEPAPLPTTKVSLKSKEDQKIFKDLIG